MKFLMVNPAYYCVDYVINFWMDPVRNLVDADEALDQWMELHDSLSSRAEVTTIPGMDGLPDMVFAANAGFVLNSVATVSRFTHNERGGEEVIFDDWFAGAGFNPRRSRILFEGAGDALYDEHRKMVWGGHGFRSDPLYGATIEQRYDVSCVMLKLVDPRFYHLDTCFCPLASGHVMYYAAAFDPVSLAIIHSIVEPTKRIEVYEFEARMFCCNGIEVGKVYLSSGTSHSLKRRLRDVGYDAMDLPLGEYLKSGGGAKCLALRLDCQTGAKE